MIIFSMFSIIQWRIKVNLNIISWSIARVCNIYIKIKGGPGIWFKGDNDMRLR